MIMKKKEYIQPQMHVTTIKTMGMLASSPVGGGISNTEATGDGLGRGSDLDEDF